MRPTTVTVTGVAASQVIVPDHYQSPSTIALGAKINSGTATYTVQHTFDDVFDPAFNAATATWLPHATMVNLTANADGNYAYAPRGIRLNVTISSGGTVTLVVNQEGIG